ncbi:MAG: hypothetical protein ACRDTX_28520 [Pseudonocardiaceae bacterium]
MNWYSPGWITFWRISAAVLVETPSGTVNETALENVLFCVEVMTVRSGKVGFAEPTGPKISRSAALDGASQPPEVMAVMIDMS